MLLVSLALTIAFVCAGDWALAICCAIGFYFIVKAQGA